jgi:preprotein translocase subunit SecG
MLVLLAFSFTAFLKGLLMLAFVLSALLLMLVVLLQEPKGGGLSSAFGGVGAETFGVQTGSVNRFTAYVAGIFMVSAILYAAIRLEDEATLTDTTRTAPEKPAPGEEEPAGGTVGPPPGDEGSQGGGAQDTGGEGGTEEPGDSGG